MRITRSGVRAVTEEDNRRGRTVHCGDGTAAAYVTTPDDPNINQPTIDYVTTLVPNQTGKKFNPQVSVGISTEDYLTKMLNENFESFTFSPASTAVYHLGNFATARTKLQGWEL